MIFARGGAGMECLEEFRRTVADPPVIAEKDQYLIKFALTEQEIESAFRLRYDVFNLEQGKGLKDSQNGIDKDEFDEHCLHLIVVRKDDNRVVGTYRIHFGAVAARSKLGFYSEQEYRIDGLAPIAPLAIEVGRTCVAPDSRNGSVVALLWSGISTLICRSGQRFLLGCVSLESTDPIHGWLIYQNLKELRDTEGRSSCNFFRSLGLDYLYVGEGNDIPSLVAAFAKVKDTSRPTVVHIHTQKGKGYAPAEADREEFHWEMPFDLETGKPKVDCSGMEDYHSLTGKFLLEKMKEDHTVVAISSGTPTVIGFTPERRKQAGRQFVDVGIAEEHAVALASGIAAGGGRPVYGVYSTFIQRCYDQLSQDLCINGNPAVITVFMGTVAGMNDVTHLGFFDIPLISNIPNMVYLAPTCSEEYFAMLEWAVRQTEYPVAIRVPGVAVVHRKEEFDTDYSELNRYKMTARGETVAILALGSFYDLGQALKNKLREESGVEATLINPRYITGLDEPMLEELKVGHRIVVTLEDGVLDGGFGEKIARYYGNSEMRVLNYGLRKEFADRYNLDELMKTNRLTDKQMAEDIAGILE